jgi:hypothetical protein
MSTSRPDPHRPGALGAASLLLLPVLATACGHEPRWEDAPDYSATAGVGIERPATPGGLGAGDLPSREPAVLGGEIELAGPLALLARGYVFVIGYDRATGGPVLVDKLDLATGVLRPSGERVLPFALGTSHSMGGGRIEALDLEVRVDLDGLVDGPDDVLARVRLPVSLGDKNVRVRLDEGARTAVPLGG